MKKSLFVLSAFVLLFTTETLFAKPKNVECIAPANVGGGWDFTCRIPAAKLMDDLKLVDGSVKVVNMAGAGGGVAYAHVVSKRKKDENLIVAGSMATATRLGQNLYGGYKADDVRWVGALGADYGVIAVKADSPFKTLDELLEAFQKNPKKTTIVGGSSSGGWDHLKVLLVADKYGIKNLKSINYIAFNSGGKALLEVISGRASAFTGDTSEILNYFDSKKIRVLAVLSDKRITRLGNTPTAKELGYDVVGANWRGFYVPKNISDARYNEWSGIIKKIALSKQWEDLRQKNGLAEFNSFGSDFSKFVRSQIEEISEISERLGLKK